MRFTDKEVKKIKLQLQLKFKKVANKFYTCMLIN